MPDIPSDPVPPANPRGSADVPPPAGGEATTPHSPAPDPTGEPPAEGPTATAPARVPGYDILRELGRGGMGVVYLAQQAKLNRVVALEVVLAGGHAGPEGLARFLAEAEVVAGLQHPSIVQLFEAGQHEGLHYFTLEYIP